MIHTPQVDLGLAGDFNTASLTGTERSEIFHQSWATPMTGSQSSSARN
jgi:hypothetical protein